MILKRTVRRMRITDISEFSKAKYKIFIDEEFAFVLYKGELRQLKVKQGEEISKETYDRIVEQIIPARARSRAIHLLEKRPYTERDLREKLLEGLYPQDVIDMTIDYLKGFRYIDDHAYAVQYIETYSGKKSLKRIMNDLMLKGVDKNIIREETERLKETGELEDEEALARRLLKKRGYDPETADRKETASALRFLYSKGFSSDTVSKVIREIF